MSDELLPYYNRELSFLRRLASQFAEDHPKIAQRLRLGADEAQDPHVERLIQASAFSAPAFATSWTTTCRRSPRQCSASCIRTTRRPFLPWASCS